MLLFSPFSRFDFSTNTVSDRLPAHHLRPSLEGILKITTTETAAALLFCKALTVRGMALTQPYANLFYLTQEEMYKPDLSELKRQRATSNSHH